MWITTMELLGPMVPPRCLTAQTNAQLKGNIHFSNWADSINVMAFNDYSTCSIFYSKVKSCALYTLFTLLINVRKRRIGNWLHWGNTWHCPAYSGHLINVNYLSRNFLYVSELILFMIGLFLYKVDPKTDFWSTYGIIFNLKQFQADAE